MATRKKPPGAPPRRGVHPRAAGRRRARRLPGRRLRGARGNRATRRDWVAGISIGAINAALIAGNPPERRVERLREFWEGVSSSPFAPARLRRRWRTSDGARDAAQRDQRGASRCCSASPGFFTPRVPAAPFQPPGTPAAISYYDTDAAARHARAPGRLRPAQFDGAVRLSVGAVNVHERQLRLFRQRPDSASTPRHVMASGALPPGFPPVEIDGEFYWDGGLVSNTPLQYVLDEPGRAPTRWSSRSTCSPRAARCRRRSARRASARRTSAISSRTRLNTTYELRRQATLQAASAASSPSCRRPARRPRRPGARRRCTPRAAVDVVHLIYRSKHYESQSKDYEFSRASMLEHWAAGLADTARDARRSALARARAAGVDGVHVFDLASDSPKATAHHHAHHPHPRASTAP